MEVFERSTPGTCWEVVERACIALATGKDEVKERLYEAALEIATLDSRQMPDELRPEYEKLVRALSRKGTIRETLATMRKDKPQSLAQRITSMASSLREICYEQSGRS